MALVTVQNACLAYGHVALLDHVDVVLQEGERVALIGRNGSGKSSLLKALAGEVGLDDGEIRFKAGCRLAHVPQEPVFPPGCSVFDAVAAGAGALAQLLADFHRLSSEGTQSDLRRLEEVQQAIDHLDGWAFDSRIRRVLTRLALNESVEVATLSGGERKRLALARALVLEPDLLLLDEPTNHLDIDGILWLEELLLGFSGTVLLITHDRRFLDRVATRIIELDRGRMSSYPGDFTRYTETKEAELAAEAGEQARFDKFLAQEEVWIRKGVEARRTRSVGRVKRLESLRQLRTERRERVGRVEFSLERGESSGRLVAELDCVGKRYGETPVVRDVSIRILRGDKVGLIGPNGAGKSTLLKLILGEISPDEGQVRLGTKLEVAYFDQMRSQLNEEATLADVISPGSEYVELEGKRKHVIGYLGDFLFAPERARSPVKSLSGGERNRLLLARLFAQPANLIVLDEPTNDLDIETLELLESLLQDYRGTLLLVSHDRAFLDNVVTQTLVAEGQGRWKEYVGGYSDWERQRPSVATLSASPSPASASPEKPARRERGRKGLSYAEQKELKGLPDRIAALEVEQKILGERLSDPALYRSGGEEVRQIQARAATLETELAAALTRWEQLETLAG